jgi:probable HAF family extracellular repeat protein
VTSLGFLPGGSASAAQNINDQGQVAGFSNNGTPDPFSLNGGGTETRGFVWRDGVMRDVGSLGGPDTLNSWQNQRGQIVGLSYTSDTPDPANGGFPGFDPFLWQNGHMTDLGTLGGTLGSANWINDAGQVVGQSDLAGDENAHPFLWQNGHMTDLGTPSGDFGSANYINHRGDAAGAYFASDGNFHGILWRGRRMTDLPPVGDAPWAFANALNDQDQVVGNEGAFNFNDGSFTEILASLWTRDHGYDLNTLVSPNPLQMTSADYIDDRGDIVGHGFMPDGSQRMFLLMRNPSVPLPASSTSRTALRQTLPTTRHATNVLAPSGAGRSSSAPRTIRWFLLDQRR